MDMMRRPKNKHRIGKDSQNQFPAKNAKKGKQTKPKCHDAKNKHQRFPKSIFQRKMKRRVNNTQMSSRKIRKINKPKLIAEKFNIKVNK